MERRMRYVIVEKYFSKNMSLGVIVFVVRTQRALSAAVALATWGSWRSSKWSKNANLSWDAKGSKVLGLARFPAAARG